MMDESGGVAFELRLVELRLEVWIGQHFLRDGGAELLTRGNITQIVHAGEHPVVADLLA